MKTTEELQQKAYQSLEDKDLLKQGQIKKLWCVANVGWGE